MQQKYTLIVRRNAGSFSVNGKRLGNPLEERTSEEEEAPPTSTAGLFLAQEDW